MIVVAATLAASLALVGCNTTQSVSPAAAEGTTISFESIDGPPRPVAARLARSLDQEATARRLVVVARGGQALYLLRGYLAAHSEGGATVVSWAFDVFDAERRRAFRFRGEERLAGGTTLATVSDETLQRVASGSITQLMTLIAADRTGASAGLATSAMPSLAGLADDFRPEASGIFRVFASAPPAAAGNDGGTVPLPPPRPQAAQRPGPPVLAYSASND
jgi:hypothetical protein